MATPHFELITELQTCIRRDFPVTTASILNPTDAAALIEGEWLQLAATTYTLERGSGDGTSPVVFPVHTERGRYDTQALGKVNVIFRGLYEAETDICTTTGFDVGDPLMVADVNIFGYSTRRGLAIATGSGGHMIVGYITKTYASPSTRVRFINLGAPFAMP